MCLSAGSWQKIRAKVASENYFKSISKRLINFCFTEI